MREFSGRQIGGTAKLLIEVHEAQGIGPFKAQLRQQGFAEGHEIGWKEGFTAGRLVGWAEGAAEKEQELNVIIDSRLRQLGILGDS